MTPENMPAPPAAAGPSPALRPPDFLLPQSEHGAARRRAGEPEIYVSWGGQIYGPAGVDDVLTGVRTAYFEEDALFWFEGQPAWRPVDELEDLFAEDEVELPVAATRHEPPSKPIRPSWPASRSSGGNSGRKRRRRAKPARSSRSSRAGRLIVLGAVLLAVLVTAGLLLLISLV